ncbi:hypothetical protein BLA60_28645 [Actinophytocola xinjiangensis]|uniref:Uncharacterized protein n=1 Tax=Actinophytocola xinjiangensis TaxID=485602 RepID=A0A7Z0WIF4_9PSEU|nr:hypothetical protein [Actinophytocola xinjiangensis]OLF07181.1 hypothetical protein BLA60_28645 [Actinophytocola xinjiangensis]
MNEHEFRSALRTSMAVTTEPPPMGEAAMLDAAHVDRRRRRTTWAGLGSAAAVVAIAAAVVAFAPPGDGGGEPGLGVAAPGSTRTPLDTRTVTTETNVAWPNGQFDNLDVSGEEYNRAGDLLDLLVAQVPDSVEVPDDLRGRGDLDGVTLKRFVAQNDGIWAYYGQAPLVRGEGVGSLDIRVAPHYPGLEDNAGCGDSPNCTELRVGGKLVELRDYGTGGMSVDHHGEAAYVSLSQSTTFEFAGYPALDQLPFTVDELAALVTDPRFQLD